VTADVGASESERVHQYCPTPLVRPLNSISIASNQFGMTTPNDSISP
jgi:hypothetical protein